MSEPLKLWRIVGVLKRQLTCLRQLPDGREVEIARHDDLDVLCYGDDPYDCKIRLEEISRDWTPDKWKEFKSARMEFFWSNGWGPPGNRRYPPIALDVDLMDLRVHIAESGVTRERPATKKYVKGVERRKSVVREEKIKNGEKPNVSYQPIVHRLVRTRRVSKDPASSGDLGIDTAKEL